MRLPFVRVGRVGENTGNFNRHWLWYDWEIYSRTIGPFFVQLYLPWGGGG